ncbi:hypothetical protein RRG08_050577 [Elysia crispata]|uniref:Uncharacterized protein n=1 Tax=Elysia crispata TaxID=231223 RepID=A0AAE0Z6W9_9GAST|nr:hypothetical protein RRG08_050577 [Elysia crispata]
MNRSIGPAVLYPSVSRMFYEGWYQSYFPAMTIGNSQRMKYSNKKLPQNSSNTIVLHIVLVLLTELCICSQWITSAISRPPGCPNWRANLLCFNRSQASHGLFRGRKTRFLLASVMAERVNRSQHALDTAAMAG